MIMHHLIDHQIFNDNHGTAIDESAALLVGKIRPAMDDAFMDPRHNLPALRSLRCPFRSGREFALGALQVFFIGAQKLRARGLFPCREGRKACQAHINAKTFARVWQGLGIHLTGNGDIPFPCRGTANRAGFGRAFQRPMLDRANGANLREGQDTLMQGTAIAILRVGQRIIPTFAPKARIAWVFACLHTAKERLEGQVHTFRHILQHLGMGLRQEGMLRFPLGQQALGFKVRDRALFLFLGSFAHFQRLVVDSATGVKGLLQGSRLGFCREEAVFHGFSHRPKYNS